MYHLPLLPGYGPNANIRSSVPAPVASYLTEAEEDGYQGTYFTQPIPRSSVDTRDGYISMSPFLTRNSPAVAVPPPSESGSSSFASDAKRPNPLHLSDSEPWTDTELQPKSANRWRTQQQDNLPPPPLPDPPTSTKPAEDDIVEAVFFEYGVVVFFGLTEGQERDILEDVENAGIMKRKIHEDDWEVEECHFTVRVFLSASRFFFLFFCILMPGSQHDPHISYPRIYNDFFSTFLHPPLPFALFVLSPFLTNFLNSEIALKSRSHLLKLSIAHALAQSTLLAHYETLAQRVLSSPQTLSIPRQLASSGSLQLRRHEALKLTGKLFKLRRDVNLVSNVLDVPELFWTEVSLGDLYHAVREYMEIGGRVQSLNEKLGVASDFVSLGMFLSPLPLSLISVLVGCDTRSLE